MRYNLNTIIERCNKKHKSFYSYENILEYTNINEKVPIICKKHGVFYQSWHGHAQGNGCPSCGLEKLKECFRGSTESFVKKAKQIHGKVYDYSEVNYQTTLIKVNINCKIHGTFYQTPNNHLRGQGCPICGREKRDFNQTKSFTDFIKKARTVHDGKYEYFTYKKDNKKTKIYCNTCNKIFYQTPNNHLSGQGCPRCRFSKGENIISRFLTENNITYEREKRFDSCIYKRKLPFDFYLTDRNSCVEFDGAQHFKPVQFGNMSLDKAKEQLKLTKIKDKIKDDFCHHNSIELIRIKYNDNIKEKLNKLIDIKKEKQ